MLKIAVITVSDSTFNGKFTDLSGPKIVEILRQKVPEVQIETGLVPDELAAIQAEIGNHLHCDYILTTGGTGISPRDVTPEACRTLFDREVPGIAEWLRAESLKETPHAVFSRGLAGIIGQSIIINLPGSLAAVKLCAWLIAPILEHGRRMIEGKKH